MSNDEFWKRVKRGADNLDVPGATYRTWKSRGRVSKQKAYELYKVLAGTESEISLERLIQ